MYLPGADAAEVASLINEFGNTITIDGGGTIKAIPDEQAASIVRQVGEMRFEEARERGGRVAMFNMTPAAYAQMTPGSTFVDQNGVRWSPEPTRNIAAADTGVMVALLATAGAVKDTA